MSAGVDVGDATSDMAELRREQIAECVSNPPPT